MSDLVTQFEFQARIDISRMKAGELTAVECTDLIHNHWADYDSQACKFSFFSKWLNRWRLVLLRDRLKVQALESALKPLPDAAVILRALQRGAKITMEEQPDGTVKHTIK